MNPPKAPPGLVDLAAVQNAVAMVLLSDDRLQLVPVLPEFKLHMESDMQVDLLWTVPRSAVQVTPDSVTISGGIADDVQGPTGAGLLVEMPKGVSHSPGVSGPPLTWTVTVVAFEERNVNWSPPSVDSQGQSSGGGTFITAEQYAQLAIAVLHQQSFFGLGVLSATGPCVSPAEDWMSLKPGIVAWRATLTGTAARPQYARSAPVTVSIAAGSCTMTCTDLSVQIRFTMDGSVPASVNPSAQLYVGAFPVLPGTVVLAASYKPGLLLSAISGATA